MSVHAPIQPDLLTYNATYAPQGMTVGEIYDAVNPWGFPGPFQVMVIQASEAITKGVILRQEMGIQSDEAPDVATGGTTTTIVDTSHGISTDFIFSGEARQATNLGYFYWTDDSTATAEYVGEVRAVTDANTFTLYDAAPAAIANTDVYNIWKPGRMKIANDDETLPPWGTAAADLTDEYYGFMIVKGWALVSVATSTVGVHIVPGTSGVGKTGTAGTDDIASIGQAGTTVAGACFIPVFVKGFPA